MAILNIRKLGDPVLRSKAQPVKKITEKTRDLIDNMAETMYDNDGVGLAAPQVGMLQRIIVVDPGDNLIELINPEILSSEGKEIGEEGCLSIPDKTGLVARAKKIVVKGLDRQGEEKVIEAEDMLARIFQHEIDHLDGTLYIDKMLNFEDDNNN